MLDASSSWNGLLLFFSFCLLVPFYHECFGQWSWGCELIAPTWLPSPILNGWCSMTSSLSSSSRQPTTSSIRTRSVNQTQHTASQPANQSATTRQDRQDQAPFCQFFVQLLRTVLLYCTSNGPAERSTFSVIDASFVLSSAPVRLLSLTRRLAGRRPSRDSRSLSV